MLLWNFIFNTSAFVIFLNIVIIGNMRHALYREIYSVIAFNRRRHILLQKLPDGESNPGLPRDRRGYLPLYYRGIQLVLRSIII